MKPNDQEAMELKRSSTIETSLLATTIVIIVGIFLAVPGLVFAEETDSEGGEGLMAAMEGSEGTADIISPITEWIGIGAVSLAGGLIISLQINDSSKSAIRKTILLLIAALSISVGLIHLLLVQEHMEESYVWGLSFLAMGIPQVAAGVIVLLLSTKKLSVSVRGAAAMYYLGIVANAFFTGVFFYVRVFVPPFSPDGAPVSEWESNGILTVIIQVIIVALLARSLKLMKADEVMEELEEKKIAQ